MTNKRGPYRLAQASWPLRLQDFRDRDAALRARLRGNVSRYSMTLPAGTTGKLRAGSMWDRLDFVADPCGHCGVQMKATAAATSFELIDEEGNALP